MYMVIFPITRSGRVQKSQKKNKKKEIFLKDVFLRCFPISSHKKGEKKVVSFFSVRGGGKCEINYKKKQNFFSSFREVF